MSIILQVFSRIVGAKVIKKNQKAKESSQLIAEAR
jgi:hypothetical protein